MAMQLQEIILKALEEDLGSGDHTSLSTIPEHATGTSRLIIKEEGILSGVDVARMVYESLDPGIQFEQFLEDGHPVRKGDIAFTVTGSVRSILAGERLALNCMQRMSGIATATNKLVQLIRGTKARILDTRKTTPLLRELEKMAVRAGGGSNHRMGLYDMLMIKDNHVDFAGGIARAIESANAYLEKKKLDLKIEIEVRNFDELEQVLAIGKVHRIMLDNFSPEDLAYAVKRIGGKYETEASGGISSGNIRAYAETGVDFISVGALTHHISSLDMSLKAVNEPSK
jgi:nicotinate-nucleotide pyrophosphorylase (carboxylating)